MNPAQFWGGAAAPYEIEQSLRLYNGSNLYWTPSSTGNQTTFTQSGWIKRAGLTSNEFFLFLQNDSTNVGTYFLQIQQDPNDTLYFSQGPSGGYGRTLAYYRDPSAWYHVVGVADYNNSTVADRYRVYVNGERVPVSFNANYNTTTTAWNNNTYPQRIGWNGVSNSYYYTQGYVAEFHHVDGQALDPTDFGEFDDNGVWRPIAYTGSYGTNGWYLKFDPSATNGIGHDHSGNGNNFTASGFDTTNTTASTYDVMSDTPTTNWCTLNPLNINDSGFTYSNGNLDLSTGGGWETTTATFYTSSGKWYYEWTASSVYGQIIGITAYPYTNSNLGVDATSYGYQQDGRKWNNNTASSYGATWTNGDVIGVAYNLDDNEITFYKNGVSQGVAFTGITSLPVSPAISIFYGSGSTNFGQRAFAYTPPTGYKALNTANLPAPTVKDGSQYFNTVLYTGTNATNAITGVGFAPNFVWVKRRSASGDHILSDSVRTAGKYLSSNLTASEVTSTDFGSFDSDGFTVNAVDQTGGLNSNGNTYVAWNWLAANGTSSIAAGSIDGTNPTIASTVSANPTAGFSIVSYTGTGANATVGHGLGVAPKMIIIKSRTDGSAQWVVYHASLGNTKSLYLNGTNSAGTSSLWWNNTSPTSSAFSLSTSSDVNVNTQNYISYCFAEVENYSRIGSYTGNQNADGPFIFCGFRPKWVLIKSTAANNWQILDSSRNTYNTADSKLYPNTSGTEDTSASNEMDLLSNGFKIRSASGTANANGTTILYMAFAENPFGGSGVSPATAR